MAKNSAYDSLVIFNKRNKGLLGVPTMSVLMISSGRKVVMSGSIGIVPLADLLNEIALGTIYVSNISMLKSEINSYYKENMAKQG